GSTPTPTPTPTRTSTFTPTRTPTLTQTPTPTPTPLPGQPVVSSITPTSGLATGGTNVSIFGVNFLPVSVVSIGGQAASSAYVGPTQLDAVSPGLPPGTLNTVTVTNPGLSGSLLNGWMADFGDVPQSSPYHGDVEKVFRNGVTAGCAAGAYCPQSPVLRSEMAVFLLKAKHGATHVPTPCAGIFADVVCPSTPSFPYSDWIEQLLQDGITGGCDTNPLRYCPDRTVSRAEMAVLLLLTKHESGYVPPPCTGIFSDVPCIPVPAFAVDWIEELSLEGITAGCGGGNYCPDQPIPREQMATLLVRTFGLP
ncbi:MAG: IPT/TIG domain-containing protein, partial [Acidobacteriota bacterium]